MSKTEEAKVPENEINKESIDIQHDDEFEDFKITRSEAPIQETKKSDWMDDWDDDAQESFTEILRKQRAHH